MLNCDRLDLCTDNLRMIAEMVVNEQKAAAALVAEYSDEERERLTNERLLGKIGVDMRLAKAVEQLARAQEALMAATLAAKVVKDGRPCRPEEVAMMRVHETREKAEEENAERMEPIIDPDKAKEARETCERLGLSVPEMWRRKDGEKAAPMKGARTGEACDPQAGASELVAGDPCGHLGCLNHLTHPCEGCGRIGGGLAHGVPGANSFWNCPGCGSSEFGHALISGEYATRKCAKCELTYRVPPDGQVFSH